MAVNILRMAVGIRSVEHLQTLQQGRVFDHGGQPAVWTITRNRPTRADEIIGGQGSLYWIIQGKIALRQPILDLLAEQDEEGRPFCRIVLSAQTHRTVPVERRPMQGWRYLDPADAPADLGENSDAGSDLPPAMLAELRQLGIM